MILNFHIIVQIIFSLVSFALACYGLLIAFKKPSGSDIDENNTFHKNYYLLSMIILILLITRSLNLVYFYYVLISLVPIIPGAMCPYGVMEANPIGFIDLIGKIFIPFVFALWILLDYLNKKSKSLVITDYLISTFKFIIFPLLFLDIILDWAYFLFLEPIVVNCCRNFFNEMNDYTPVTLLGPDTAFLFFIVSILMIISLLILQIYQTKQALPTKYSSVLVVVAVPIFIIALFEFIAPVWVFASKTILNQELGQPHHCPFCLIKRWPFMAVTVLSMWIGFASMGWYSIVEWKTSNIDELALPLSQLLVRLRLTSIISFFIGLVLIFVHMIFFLFNNALLL